MSRRHTEMKKHELRFRQVHLDFHTSPKIDGLGERFDKQEWQDTLRQAHVDSITCFSVCHHGWSYHPTTVGQMHPGLKFNLLRAQMDACHEIDIKVPVYLTAGFNDRLAELHPEWRQISPEGQYCGVFASPLMPGFQKLCFNSPYLDYLCEYTRETLQAFPDADGLFFDIIIQGECCCPHCLKGMMAAGLNPESQDDRRRFAWLVLQKYYRRITETVQELAPNMPVFHNSGHFSPANRDLLKFFSHLELESLPTGGWGYDHFLMTAAYSRVTEYDFLGMTGKFHTTWGEFGGFKHPNALRYECAAMLAQGAKCSVGDQLHPDGQLDKSTYRLIGAAYAEVEQKEPWCRQSVNTAQVAILAPCAFRRDAIRSLHSGADGDGNEALTGASRFLLEEHIPFDILDEAVPFENYRILLLPDVIRISPALQQRLERFLAQGGKLVLSGEAGLREGQDDFALDLGATTLGLSPFCPDYLRPAPAFAPEFLNSPCVMSKQSRRLKITTGQSLGEIFDPYFNRAFDHYSSHQHTPFRPEPTEFSGGSLTRQTLYFAHPVFQLYALSGNVLLRQFLGKAFRRLAGDEIQIRTNLPSQGRVFLRHQPAENRYVLHLLYANTILRGTRKNTEVGKPFYIWPATQVEVIEELNPFPNLEASILIPEKVQQIFLEPQHEELPVVKEGGRYHVKLRELVCHQMIVFHC